MSLKRVLETEYMDTEDEAKDYDSMDHSEVNRVFVEDLMAVDGMTGDILDLGTGTALIPIELCKANEDVRVMAVDMAVHMLEIARYNIEAEGFTEQIELAQVDAKNLDIEDDYFDVVMSNSIIHHIPSPLECIREAVRVTKPGGVLFFRDLMRPASSEEVTKLVEAYAGTENDHQKQMFDDSLRAALSLEEIREMVESLGFDPATVQATTDRHWTWVATRLDRH